MVSFSLTLFKELENDAIFQFVTENSYFLDEIEAYTILSKINHFVDSL